MDKKKLEKKLLEFLAAKATEMQGQDQESMDYSTNIEELADCTFLLENGLSDDAIFKVANSTTSGRLYDLVKNLAKPASEVRHKNHRDHRGAYLCQLQDECEEHCRCYANGGGLIPQRRPCS